MNPILTTSTTPSRIVRVEGREYLWFSGTDYLGMAHNADYIGILAEGLKRFGTHFGSSRNNTLQIGAYAQAEKNLAEFTGAEDAMLSSSGMLSGHLVRSALPGVMESVRPGKKIIEIEAPGLHPALKRGSAVISDWQSWADFTTNRIRTAPDNEYFIIYSDSVGSPTPVSPPFSHFANLENILLVIDDSHGIGVLGESGCGSFRNISGMLSGEALVVTSLNKGMGIPGGAILGNNSMLQKFRKTGIYAGASPFPPVFAYAFSEMYAKNIYTKAHELLIGNTRKFLNKLNCSEQFHNLPDYPVFTVSDSGLFDSLLKTGILCSSFPYPTVEDIPLTRLAITAAHTNEDIDRLAEACNRFYAA